MGPLGAPCVTTCPMRRLQRGILGGVLEYRGLLDLEPEFRFSGYGYDTPKPYVHSTQLESPESLVTTTLKPKP